jgi:hypothetical protein
MIPSGSLTSDFAMGVTFVTINSRDAAGNIAIPCNFKIIVSDRVPPTVVVSRREWIGAAECVAH